jgi:hypothetical protein
MATTKKKTETINSKEGLENIKLVDKEKELLKEKLASQEKEMSDLKAQMEMLLKSLSNKEEKENNKTKNNKKTIKFINMTTGGFTIRGTRLYHLDKQFDFQVFSESEARVIVNNMPNSIANGQLYIADHNFVEECELDYIYESLIDDKTLKDLLNKSSEDVCEIYKNASDSQKKIIVDMIMEKQINEEKIDANVLVDLGKLCGIDFMKIEPLEKEE